jgi:predicted enzyme related to lactoylglutathione lyase
MLKSCPCIVYVVDNLAQSRRWYEQNLGGKVVEDAPGWVGIRLESGQMIGLHQREPGQPRNPVCAFYRVDDIKAALAQLTSAGSEIIHELTDVGTVLIAIVRNPDGLPIGLQQTKG